MSNFKILGGAVWKFKFERNCRCAYNDKSVQTEFPNPTYLKIFNEDSLGSAPDYDMPRESFETYKVRTMHSIWSRTRFTSAGGIKVPLYQMQSSPIRISS